MIQPGVYHSRAAKGNCFANPPIVLRENKQAPLLNIAGIVAVRNFVDKLEVASTIDDLVSVFARHRPYRESDHVLNFVYNMLSGGEVIHDIKRLQESEGFLRIMGADRIPDPTSAGMFLTRFNRKSLDAFQQSLDRIQDRAWRLMKKERKQVATVEHDSSIHEVYGQRKEGADFAYNKTYSYSVQYVTLAETGDVLHQELREGHRYSSYGFSKILPDILDRVSSHFDRVRFRADSASYSKDIVHICDERDATFYISADKTGALMREVLKLEESAWKSFRRMNLSPAVRNRSGKTRKKRRNHKAKVVKHRSPKSTRPGRKQIASLYYQPTGWQKPYRFVVKRTELVDQDGQQYLEDGMCKYVYHIIVTNDFTSSDTRAMHIAQQRANQENLIKDMKHGLGLTHIPSGRLIANQIYIKIAALAWNIKTWMLNLLSLGNGAVVRFKRFLYEWIYHACTVSKTGRSTVVVTMDRGEYFSRYSKAISAIQHL